MSTRRPYTRTARGTGLTKDAVYLPTTYDHKGIFYHLGGGTSVDGWANPVPGRVIATSSEAPIAGTLVELTDRSGSDVATPDTPNSWYRWDLPVPVMVDAWEVRHRNFYLNSNLAGTCKLQGSNDGSTWDDLATTTFTGGRDSWELESASSSTWYRSIRIYQSGVGSTRPEGDDYLCLGEVELYGWVL